MAIKILKEKGCDIDSKLSVKIYQADSETDVANLPNQSTPIAPCDTGSRCFVVEPASGKEYVRVLNSKGQWKEDTTGTIIDCGSPADRT